MTESGEQVRRGKIKRYIEGGGFVVAVEVPVIFTREQPDEPLLEAATLRFLDEVTERAHAGDVEWLSTVGEVYIRKSA